MRIRVNSNGGPFISTHAGKGSERKMLFISPWGASIDVPIPAPKDADLRSRTYELDVAGEVEKILGAAIKNKHPGLLQRMEILEEKDEASKGKGKKADPKF